MWPIATGSYRIWNRYEATGFGIGIQANALGLYLNYAVSIVNMTRYALMITCTIIVKICCIIIFAV